jgi:hypothetical protein
LRGPGTELRRCVRNLMAFEQVQFPGLMRPESLITGIVTNGPGIERKRVKEILELTFREVPEQSRERSENSQGSNYVFL